MKKIYTALFCALCITGAYGGACPPAYPNKAPGTTICYLITAPGEYVPYADAGPVPCPIGEYCPGGEKIYNLSQIPTRYTPVEYLENNNSAYIDTGHIPTSDTTVNADIMITGGTLAPGTLWMPVFGTRGIGTDSNYYVARYSFFINSSDGEPNFDYFNIELYNYAGNFLNKRFNMKTQIADNQIHALVDNVIAYSTPVTPAPDFKYGIYLFAMANDYNPRRQTYGRFYFYQVRESDNLIQYMIPVYDTESKLYGMYDIASGTFFTSANDDKFTGGPVVETVPLPDIPTRGGNYSCADATHNEFISSPPKSETITDCGKILHIGSSQIYLRRRKITPHALATQLGDTIFYAEMTTEQCGHLRTNLDGVAYSICNIGTND